MTSSNENKLGVVIPTYKESESIASLIEAILKAEPSARIVVVDDSPNLDTVEAVNRLGLPQARITHREGKGGRGSAVIEGIRQLLGAGCEKILEMDADFSHPPGQIPELLSQARSRELDLLIASRYILGSRILNWPLSRHIFSGASNRLARAVLRIPVADYTNGYRLYSRRAAQIIVDTCGKLGKGFIALSEILVNLYYRGCRIGETPTVFTNRVRGESSLNWAEIRNAIIGLYRISFLVRQLKREQKKNVRLEAGR